MKPSRNIKLNKIKKKGNDSKGGYVVKEQLNKQNCTQLKSNRFDVNPILCDIDMNKTIGDRGVLP